MTELSEIIVYIAKSGVFALLFTLLLAYILKDSSKREAKYQLLIDNLSDDLHVVRDIARDVKEIKRCISFQSAVSTANYRMSSNRSKVC